MRPIAEIVSGLYPVLWPTARMADGAKNVRSPEGSLQEMERKGTAQDIIQAAHAMLWATPTSLAPARNGNNEAGNSAGLVSIREAALSLWPTANASDEKWRYSTVEAALRRIETGKQVSLECAAHAANLWPTPRVSSERTSVSAMDRQDSMSALSMEQAAEAASGIVPREVFLLRPEMVQRLGFSALWPTPAAGMHNDGEDPESFRARQAKWKNSEKGYHNSPPLPIVAKETEAALWPTAAASDDKRGADLKRRDCNAPNSNLPTAVVLWTTASARDWKDTPGMTTVTEDGRVRLDQLPRQAALYPTPTAVDGDRGITVRPHDQGKPLPQVLGMMLGLQSEPTEKPGALNPEFVCWLMGFPAEWLFAAPSEKAKPRSRKKTGTAGSEPSEPSATPSSRRSRPKSSAPTSTPKTPNVFD
jgi:hypothetical protein